MRTPIVIGLLLTSCLIGCYTQLYTNGYLERARDQQGAEYAYRPRRAADTPQPMDSASLAGQWTADSAANVADSIARANDLGAPSGSVIVNNYYDRPYRGYSTLDWDYPFISFGFYSSRYRDYWDPYWWHAGGYRSGYYRSYNNNVSPIPGGGSGYRSDRRLFVPAPSHPAPNRGRRSGTPAPAAKSSANGGSSYNAPSGSGNSGGSTNDGQSDKSDSKDANHPQLEKGKRR